MPAALRIALRELSGGLKGFWIYLACLALGVSAIAASGSVTEAFNQGLTAEARTILGGDVRFQTSQRRVNSDERTYIESLGQTSETIDLDVMGSANSIRQQVNVFAVDGAYPLIGDVELSLGAETLQTALARQNTAANNDEETVWGIAVSQTFFDTFKVSIGDTVSLGPVRAKVTARLDRVPQRLGTPGAFAPQAYIAMQPLLDIDRLSDGQLFYSRIAVLTENDTPYERIRETVNAQFPDAGLRVRSPSGAVRWFRNIVDILNSFLSIIGIAALIAGGVGVSQATSAFLDSRLGSIAALKALGASSKTVRNAYTIQMGILAIIGSGIGVAIGAATPFLMALFAGDKVPIPQAVGFYPRPLILALSLGLLCAAIFALPAIGRARATPARALFRSLSEQEKTKAPWFERSLALLAFIALGLIAVGFSANRFLTGILLFGAILCWLLFRFVAWLIKKYAGRRARKATGFRRIALSNLGGPASLAPTIVPALGLGIALLSFVAAVQTNVLGKIASEVPDDLPSLVANQIPHDKVDAFDAVFARYIDTADLDIYKRAPIVLARVQSLNGERLTRDNVNTSFRWVVRGEIFTTILPTLPDDAPLAGGRAWPADYSGPLQVSIDTRTAEGINAKVGDTLGIRVFGRELEANVANLRAVDWGNQGGTPTPAFVFSPGTLEAAKPSHVAFVKTSAEQDKAIIADLETVVPDVVVFQTRTTIDAAKGTFNDVSLAIKAAAGVVILAGLLVLLGAFAALARKRRSEAALLKTFGAKRSEILRLYATEFAIAGGSGAILGSVIGIAGAYPVIRLRFDFEWIWPLADVAIIVGIAVLISAVGGYLVGVSTLRQPPLRVLRSV